MLTLALFSDKEVQISLEKVEVALHVQKFVRFTLFLSRNVISVISVITLSVIPSLVV